jgi:serine/threonine protein kinase
MFTFDPEKFIEDQQIGQGSFGIVCPYRSKNDPDGNQLVVKQQTVDFLGLISVVQEIALGFDCKHPNILSINGFDIQKLPKPVLNQGKRIEFEVYIKMPRMEKSLRDVINRQEVVSETQILRYFQGIVSGLTYLHEKGIAHRDIKPDNIDRDDTIKIADIGIAKYLDNFTTIHLHSIAGTPNFMAPEAIEKGDRLTKDELCHADLWSLGVTLLELCLLREVDLPNLAPQLRKESLTNHILTLQGKYSNSLFDLLLSLLKDDPTQRIKINKLAEKLEHLLVSIKIVFIK